MEDVSDKYLNMIQAFECDYIILLDDSEDFKNNGCVDLKRLSKGYRFWRDFDLLKELSFDLRHGFLKIYDVRKCDNDN